MSEAVYMRRLVTTVGQYTAEQGELAERMRARLAEVPEAGGIARMVHFVYDHSAIRRRHLELTLDVQRIAGRPGRVVLVGMLFDEEAPPGEMQRATASLLEGGFVVSSTALDELGNFVLDDIAPGDYSLSLRLPQFEVVVEALNL